MKIINNKVGVTPFPTTSVTTEVRGGLPVIKQKQELTKLLVVIGNKDCSFDLKDGDYVWVRGESMKHQYAKEVFDHEGKPFILLPLDQIVATETV